MINGGLEIVAPPTSEQAFNGPDDAEACRSTNQTQRHIVRPLLQQRLIAGRPEHDHILVLDGTGISALCQRDSRGGVSGGIAQMPH